MFSNEDEGKRRSFWHMKKNFPFLKLKPFKKFLKGCFEDEYCPLKLQSFYPNMPYNLVSGVSVQSRQQFDKLMFTLTQH